MRCQNVKLFLREPLEGAKQFFQNDPHLKALQKQLLVYRSPLLKKLPRYQEGIYTIGGGRQVGKTTLLKQWMADLLKNGVTPKRIVYFTGELQPPKRRAN